MRRVEQQSLEHADYEVAYVTTIETYGERLFGSAYFEWVKED